MIRPPPFIRPTSSANPTRPPCATSCFAASPMKCSYYEQLGNLPLFSTEAMLNAWVTKSNGNFCHDLLPRRSQGSEDFLVIRWIRSFGLGGLFTQPVWKKGSVEQGYAENGCAVVVYIIYKIDSGWEVYCTLLDTC